MQKYINQKVYMVKGTRKDKKHPYAKISVGAVEEAMRVIEKENVFKLYMYMLMHKQDTWFALCRDDVQKKTNLSKHQYQDAVHWLIAYGFLVEDQYKKDYYMFYENPLHDSPAYCRSAIEERVNALKEKSKKAAQTFSRKERKCAEDALPVELARAEDTDVGTDCDDIGDIFDEAVAHITSSVGTQIEHNINKNNYNNIISVPNNELEELVDHRMTDAKEDILSKYEKKESDPFENTYDTMISRPSLYPDDAPQFTFSRSKVHGRVPRTKRVKTAEKETSYTSELDGLVFTVHAGTDYGVCYIDDIPFYDYKPECLTEHEVIRLLDSRVWHRRKMASVNCAYEGQEDVCDDSLPF